MTDYEQLIEDLQSPKAQLERERGMQFTEKDLRAFITDLLKGTPGDKDFQRKIIDNLVIKVFVGDGFITVHFNIGNGTEIEEVRLEEIKTALEHIFSVQTLSRLAQRKGICTNHFYKIKQPFQTALLFLRSFLPLF